MRPFRFRLWQSIFINVIILLVISQLVTMLLYKALVGNTMRDMFTETTIAKVNELQGKSLEAVQLYMRIDSHGPHATWLTRVDGGSLDGKALPSVARFRPEDVVDSWQKDGVRMTEVSGTHFRLRAEAVLHLKEGEYRFFMAYGPPPRLLNPLLFHLSIPVLLVSSALAFWMAWRVSRPLRRLHDEVQEMSRTGPGCRVTVSGRNEITDVARAVNELTESLARHVQGMRDLVVNVSHELRSPLARANMALGIVEESLPPEYTLPGPSPGTSAEGDGKKVAMAAKYLAALQEELNHMDSLIGTTLLTQKLETRRDLVQQEEVDFSALCDEVADRYDALFTRSGFIFSRDVAPGLYAMGNRPLLVQALSNLLDNTLKYTSPGGEVRLDLTRRRESLVFSVENTHPPLEPGKLEHIFDPFYRVNQATGTGVGLGLALVQKTAILHGGDVMAVATDIGICVCLQIPLMHRDAAG